jgi:O-antigen/teichoic acid export membrane protein
MSPLICEVRIARHAIYNILGHAGPLIVALIVIPILVKNLGTARFGILHYAWMVVGCFSLFDLGIGRILTKLVAKKMSEGREQDIPPLVWTSQVILFLLGVVLALLGAFSTPFLVEDILKIPGEIEQETIKVFFLLCLSLPIVISTASIRGVLEAHKCFGITSSIRIFVGMFSFLGPLVTLFFSHSLFVIVAVLVGGRIVGWIAHIVFCLRTVESLKTNISFAQEAALSVFNFGGWMTITNIIHLLIAYLVSVTAVAYYATPYEMVTNFLIISGSIIKVLFPALTSSFIQNRHCTAPLFLRGIKHVFLIIFPIIALIVAFAHEGLNLWLGPEFAQHSAKVLRWLAIGVFLNSLLQVPFALIQSAGRPDLTAKLNTIELPAYIFSEWFMISRYGIWGAAVVWFARQVVDGIILFLLAKRILKDDVFLVRRVGIPVGTAVIYFFLVAFLADFLHRGLTVILPLIAGAPIIWYLVLTREERIAVWSYIKMLP